MTHPIDERPPFIEIGAQFYDLLHRSQIEARAEAIIDGLASEGLTPSRGLLDFAAGTGVLTTTLARRWESLPCWALEPSRAMRIALITNIEACSGLAERITVLPGDARMLTRRGFVDVVTAMWCLHVLRSHELALAIAALRDALVPGGVLVTETPRRQGPSAAPVLQTGTARLGEHTISWDYTLQRDEAGGYDARYAYTWRDGAGEVLYADADRTGHGPEPFADLPAALETAGFMEVARFADPVTGTISIFANSGRQRRRSRSSPPPKRRNW